MYPRGKKHFTPEQYLAMEERSDTKSEFYRGEIFAMAGASSNHNLLVSNTITSLNQFFRGKPCLVYPSDMRLWIRKNDLATYPDVMVVCGRPLFYEGRTDTVTNPIVIVEVLSESTRDYDRGFKFELYRAIESLRDYVLVDQTKIHVEHHHRMDDGRWVLEEFSEPDATLTLESISFTVRIGELYEKVDFGV